MLPPMTQRLPICPRKNLTWFIKRTVMTPLSNMLKGMSHIIQPLLLMWGWFFLYKVSISMLGYNHINSSEGNNFFNGNKQS